LAALEVPLEVLRLRTAERPEREGGQVVRPAVVRVFGHRIPCVNAARIFSRPRRILPFTVPRGTARISAISDWLKPPQYASSSALVFLICRGLRRDTATGSSSTAGDPAVCGRRTARCPSRSERRT